MPFGHIEIGGFQPLHNPQDTANAEFITAARREQAIAAEKRACRKVARPRRKE
jgi:hypothetical protein